MEKFSVGGLDRKKESVAVGGDGGGGGVPGGIKKMEEPRSSCIEAYSATRAPPSGGAIG